MDTKTKNNELSAVKLGLGYAVNAVSNTISPVFNTMSRIFNKGMEKAPYLTLGTTIGTGLGIIIGVGETSLYDGVLVFSISLALGGTFEAGVRSVNYLEQASKDAKNHKKQAHALKSN